LIAGTYQVSIRDAVNTSCVIDLDAAGGTVLTEPAVLSATITTTDVTVCFGEDNGEITVSNPSGGAGTYEYSKDNGSTWQASGSFTGLIAGTYQVSIRDAVNTSCVIDLDAAGGTVLTEPAVLSATITTTDVTVCFGEDNGEITVSNPSGGAGTYEYSKDNGSNWQASGSFTGLTAGTYQVSIRDAVNTSCVIDLDAAGGTVLTEPAVLSATITTTDVTVCFGEDNGEITVSNPSGGAGTYEYSKDNGSNWQASGSFTGLTAGTYQVSIRDAVNTSCVIDLDAAGGTVLTEPAVLSATITTTDVTVCFGEDNGEITVSNPSGGAGTYEYSKDNGSTWQASGSFTGLTAGTYQVSIRDAVNTSCVIDLDAAGGTVLTEPAVLSATITTTDVTVCFGEDNGEITVSNPSGGAGTYEYSKDNGSNWQASGSFTGLTAGTYQVSIRDAVNTSCVIDLDAAGGTVLTEPAVLSATIATTNITCFGGVDGEITVSNPSGGAGTYEYSKDNGSNWQASGSFTGLTAGTYQVSIRDAVNTSCVIDLDAAGGTVLTEPAVLSATIATTNITCFGGVDGEITVSNPSGGAGTYEYSKDNGSNWQASGSFTGLTAGTYQVSIRDAVNTSCVIDLDAAGGTVLTEPADLSVTNDPISNASCFNTSDGKHSNQRYRRNSTLLICLVRTKWVHCDN
jgi:uncharacterized lipoprotein